MRLSFACFQCFSELPYPTPLILVEYQDSNLYKYTYPNGHQVATIVKKQKLEILFDIGAHAILDGYYRESVASFASSLERFYEFFIKIKLAHDAISSDVIDESWKHVSKQSERQLGAFILLYTQEFGSAPTLLAQGKVNFRNEVIHKGRIPSKAEAMDFGQSILDIINPIADKMNLRFGDSILELTNQQIERYEEELRKSNYNTLNLSHYSDPSLLNVSTRSLEYTPITLAAGLAHMENLKIARS